MESNVLTPLEQNIITTKSAVQLLISDIKNFKGSAENLKKLNELGRVKIYALRDLIDRLETYAPEQSEEMMKKLCDVVRSEKDQLQSILKDFQKANVESMLCIERSTQEELFAMSNPEELLRRRNIRNQSSLLQQNSEITDDLLTVSRQLAEIVTQSSETLQTLVKSSTNITGIHDELKTSGSIIDQSGKILNKYAQREFTDKILIMFAFAFFLACVAYVIYSRI